MAVYNILRGVSMFLKLVHYLLILYCVLTWILPPYNKLMMRLNRFFDPLLRPVRNLVFRIFPHLPVDFSPLILSFLINLMDSLMWRVFWALYR